MAEVGSAWVTVMPSAKGFQRNLGSAISGPATAAGAKAGTQAGQRFGGSLKSAIMPIGGIFAGVFAAQKVGQFFSTAVSGASDMNETMATADTIFGENAGEIQKWAKGAATNFGLSRESALRTATGFGNMLSQIGFTGAEATNLSKGIVGLSADLGSFNNLPTADVADMISSAFRGEYDSLQRLIPNINAARVEQEALAATGKTSADALTAQEKAAATLAIVQKDGAAAAGAFARESGSLAGQQKIAAAQWTDLKTTIGQGLLPVMTSFTTFLNTTAIPALSSIGGAVSKVAGWFSGGERSLGGAMSGLLVQIQPIWAQIKAVFQSAFDAIVGIVTWGVGIVQGFWDRFGIHILTFITTTWDNIRTVFSGALSVIQGIFDVFAGAFTGDWSRVWDGIKQILSGVWDVILGTVKQTINLVKTIIGGVMAGISQAWSAIWNTIKTVASNIWEAIKSAVSSAISAVRTSISNTVETIKTLWSAGWAVIRTAVSTAWEEIKTAVVDKIADVVGYIRELPGRMISALGNLGSLLFSAGRDIISGLWEGLKSMWTNVTGWFSGLGDTISGLVSNALDMHSPSRVMIPLGKNTMAGFVVGLDKGLPGVGGVFAGIGNAPPVGRTSPAPAAAGFAGGRTRITLVVGDREFNAYVDERADARVDGKFAGGQHRARLG